MARNFAQFQSRAWTDDHFKSNLTADSQWLYFALLSQPNINTAGVLPLQDRRWKKLAKAMTADRIEGALEELSTYWYVLIDEDTEEVLIRTFIRNDGLWKQPNVLKSALGHANNTMSNTLKVVIWHEVGRLPLHELEEGRAKRTRELIEKERPTLHGTLPEGFMEPPSIPSVAPFGGPEQVNHAPVIPITRPAQENPQVDALQPTLPSDLWEGFAEGFPKGFREGSGVGAGVGEGAGESLVSEAKPEKLSISPSGERDTATPKPGSDQDPEWLAFWSRYPNKVSKKKARECFARARKRVSFEALMAGLERYLTEDRRALDGYIKDPTVWLNGDCWDDEPIRRAGGNTNVVGGARDEVPDADYWNSLTEEELRNIL